jgi:mannitol/fructose-specific phosphotransferase system IIA component (Ntr-type)
LAISQKGVDWNSPDKKPAHMIVLLGAQKSYNEQYLQLLSRIAAVFNDLDTITKIESCSNSNDLMTVIRDREKSILSS